MVGRTCRELLSMTRRATWSHTCTTASTYIFAQALDDGGFTSWIGGNHETTSWLVPKWGDVHLHETVISHIRRLLDTDFACTRLGETPSQFAKRMKKVENYMNSDAFAKADGGRGLMGWPTTCQHVARW